MFYSKSTGFFYDPALNGAAIPGDAVEITAKVHVAMLAGLARGETIVGGVDGFPALVAPAAPTLADLKAAKNTEINARRLKANRGTFSHAGKIFACDELSRSDIDGANGMIANLGSMPPGWPGGWKAVDNTVLRIATVADWKAFYGSMFASGNTNFIHAQDLKTALAAATTAAQVAAIVW